MSRSFAAIREVNPTQEQIGILLCHIGSVRFAQNWALSFVKTQLSFGTKQSWSFFSLHTAWVQHREKVAPWYTEISKSAFQYGVERASKALNNFSKNKKHFRFPKFRKKGNNDSICYTAARYHSPVEIKLPRIPGLVQLKEPFILPENTRITGVFVRQRAGRWFITFRLKEDVWTEPQKAPITKSVGVDAGIGNRFATLSDGAVTDNPRFFRKSEQRLKFYQKALSRKQKGSNRREQAKRHVARLHFQISCQRKDFIHKFTTSLVKSHDEIIVEDLNLHGMKSALKLGKSISDVAWGEVVRQLQYKCIWYGKTLTIVSRWFPSSKQCHKCEHINKDLTLPDRTWVCPNCDTKLDRDLNAAINLLSQSGTAGSSPVPAHRDSVRPGEEVVPSLATISEVRSSDNMLTFANRT